MTQMCLISILTTLSILMLQLAIAANEEVTLDGTQYVTYSLVTRPVHRSQHKLSIVFKTLVPSCLLFFASGISGDYIALELFRGKLR